jgi:hypothetical protein
MISEEKAQSEALRALKQRATLCLWSAATPIWSQSFPIHSMKSITRCENGLEMIDDFDPLQFDLAATDRRLSKLKV